MPKAVIIYDTRSGDTGIMAKAIEEGMKEAGVEVIKSDLAIKFVPDEDAIKKCIDFGRAMASKIG